MMMTMTMMLSSMLAIMATTMTNPLSIGLTLLMMTATTALTTSKLTMSSWFSYVMLLIFIGGMMVLFIYVTSLAPNEKFKISKQTTVTMTIIMMMMVVATTYYLQPWENMPLTSNMNEMSTTEMSMKNLSAKIYNSSTYLITLITMNYLLLTLIAVVKITNSFKGPMRMQK